MATTTLQTIGTAALAAGKVVQDPYLPEVACHLLRINQMEQGLPPGGPCKRTPRTAYKGGVGMRYLATPLRVAAWSRQNPILAIGAVAGTVGLIYYLGYSSGKRRSR